MLTHNEKMIEAQLRGIPGVEGVKVEGKTVRQFVQEVLADSLAQLKKNKLTWNKGQMPEPNDPKKRVGKLRLDKTFIGPIGRGRYYVQNMRVFLANGQPIKDLRSISDKPIKEMVKQGGGTGTVLEVEYPSDRSRVEEALRAYASQAAMNDPNLCPYCFMFSSPKRTEMTRHVYDKHPKNFNEEMAMAPSADDEDVPTPDSAEPESTTALTE
jgi:hypothetical protein